MLWGRYYFCQGTLNARNAYTNRIERVLVLKGIFSETNYVCVFTYQLSNYGKCVSLNNQKYMIQATVINLHPNEQRQEFHYYSFTVKLDECVGSCNTLNDLSNKVCITNKTEDLNLSMLNVITGINESKILTKHISCKC